MTRKIIEIAISLGVIVVFSLIIIKQNNVLNSNNAHLVEIRKSLEGASANREQSIEEALIMMLENDETRAQLKTFLETLAKNVDDYKPETNE